MLSGKLAVPRAIRIGYFSQDQMDELMPGETVLDHVRAPCPRKRTVARSDLRPPNWAFPMRKVDTKIELSGGEKVRLLLGLMAMQKPAHADPR